MYRALRVQKVDGRRVMPGDLLPNAHKWKHLQSYINAGFIEEVPDETENKPATAAEDTELDALRAVARDLGIRGFANMKKETLLARIEEAKQSATSDQEG